MSTQHDRGAELGSNGQGRASAERPREGRGARTLARVSRYTSYSRASGLVPEANAVGTLASSISDALAAARQANDRRLGSLDPVEEEATRPRGAGRGRGNPSTHPAAGPDEPEPPPPPDPALVKALVDKTGEPATDNALHLRLEVTPRPAGELWLVGVVNRGTEAATLHFDLRRLTLTLTPPEATDKSRGRWQPKPSR